MEGCSNIPIQCATMDPLYNTPARLMVGDIIKMKPFLGSHSLFLYKNHPINSVDIFGLVTSLKRKEDSWVCNIDDGSGCIQCFCPVKRSQKSFSNHSGFKSLSNSLQKRLTETNKVSAIALGDFIRAIGYIKLGLWNKIVYITNCRWEVLRYHNMDEVWLQMFQEQVKLYEEVYDKPFVLTEEMLMSAKSFVSKDIRENLHKYLDPIITNFISDPENTSPFFGYELLELNDVKRVVSECMPQHQSIGQPELLSKNEQNTILSNTVVTLLHKHVASGVVMKKKRLFHEVVTNLDQLDARYYVTANCKSFLTLVQSAVVVLNKQESPVTGSAVLDLIESYDFNFLRHYKHGVVVVENALTALNVRFFE